MPKDDAILATLTEDEIAAMAEDELGDGPASPDPLAGEGKDLPDDDKDDDDKPADAAPAPDAKPAEPDAAQAPAPAPAPAPTTAADAAPASAEEPATPRQHPVYQADLPADFDQQMADIQEQQKALREKFRAGEIELDEYELQRDGLAEQKAELDRARIKAEVATEMTEQSAAAEWQATIDRNLAEFRKPENGGIDYNARQDLVKDLDTFVRQLGAREENADKSGDWFLKEAHKRVMVLHDLTPAKAPAPAPTPAPPSVPNRKADLSAVPPTLAHVPGSDGPGDVESRYADIDRLEGLELEAAIARMSPADRERYLAGM